MKNNIAKKVVNAELNTVTFQFTNGTETVISPDNFNDEIKQKLLLFAISEKFGNSYAGAAQNGGIDPVGWAINQVDAMHKSMLDGKYSVGGGANVSEDLLAALLELAELEGHTISRDAMKDRIAKMDKEQKAKVRKIPAVNKIIKRLQAERAEKAADDSDAPDLAGLFS